MLQFALALMLVSGGVRSALTLGRLACKAEVLANSRGETF